MGSRIYGIDYLRGILSILVVTWHMGGGGFSLINFIGRESDHSFTFPDFINFHILLNAVPCFIMISNYLFVSKNPDLRALRKTLGRLFLLASFWPLVFIMYGGGNAALNAVVVSGKLKSIEFLVTAGNTIYYFFVSLIFTQILAYVAVKLDSWVVYAGFGLSVAVLLLTPAAAAHWNIPKLAAFWSPLNFIAPCLCAICMVRLGDKLSVYKYSIIASCAAMTVLLAVIEWKISVSSAFWATDYSALPAYTRPSLTFTSALFVILCLNFTHAPGAIFRFLSDNSLALYCIHPFLIPHVNNAVTNMFGANLRSVTIPAVILLSYLVSVVLKFYLRGEVIGKNTPRTKNLASNPQSILN